MVSLALPMFLNDRDSAFFRTGWGASIMAHLVLIIVVVALHVYWIYHKPKTSLIVAAQAPIPVKLIELHQRSSHDHFSTHTFSQKPAIPDVRHFHNEQSKKSQVQQNKVRSISHPAAKAIVPHQLTAQQMHALLQQVSKQLYQHLSQSLGSVTKAHGEVSFELMPTGRLTKVSVELSSKNKALGQKVIQSIDHYKMALGEIKLEGPIQLRTKVVFN